jgi:hypothetical protein
MISIVKRLGTPRDLYVAMRYFLGKDADCCTGPTLMVNGGIDRQGKLGPTRPGLQPPR